MILQNITHLSFVWFEILLKFYFHINRNQKNSEHGCMVSRLEAARCCFMFLFGLSLVDACKTEKRLRGFGSGMWEGLRLKALNYEIIFGRTKEKMGKEFVLLFSCFFTVLRMFENVIEALTSFLGAR